MHINIDKKIKYSNIPSFPTGSTEWKNEEKNKLWLNILHKKNPKHSYRINNYYKTLSGMKNNTVNI